MRDIDVHPYGYDSDYIVNDFIFSYDESIVADVLGEEILEVKISDLKNGKLPLYLETDPAKAQEDYFKVLSFYAETLL